MKKIAALLLSLVLIFTTGSLAVAEKITLRNGFHYHASMDEIKGFEKANGNLPVPDSTLSELYSKDTILCFDAEVLGEACKLVYFDSADGVEELQYDFTGFSDNGVGFNPMVYYNELTKQYGAPCLTEWGQSPFNQTHCNTWVSYMIDGNPNYFGWLVEFDDCYLLIELAHKQCRLTKTYVLHGLTLNYKMLSAEDVEKLR